MSQFHAAVRHDGRHDDHRHGRHDRRQAPRPALDAAYDACDERQAGTVALDFDDVDYINSTGIALLVALLARARERWPTGAGVGVDRPLPGDLRDHPAGRLPGGVRGRADRSAASDTT